MFNTEKFKRCYVIVNTKSVEVIGAVVSECSCNTKLQYDFNFDQLRDDLISALQSYYSSEVAYLNSDGDDNYEYDLDAIKSKLDINWHYHNKNKEFTVNIYKDHEVVQSDPIKILRITELERKFKWNKYSQ